MLIHALFDVLAAGFAWVMIGLSDRMLGADAKRPAFQPRYGLWLAGGAILGAYGLGTANLAISGIPGIGRSILGALAGAIAGVELYKLRHGVRGSTGLIFAPGFAACVAVGRIGCYLAGLQDQTFGTVTTLPWGHDFGDGLLRHPVQLYESGVMAAFLALSLILIARRVPWFLRHGFYLMVATYAVQRFAWEFLKPYAPLVGPFNLFHLTCVALLAYALIMMSKVRP